MWRFAGLNPDGAKQGLEHFRGEARWNRPKTEVTSPGDGTRERSHIIQDVADRPEEPGAFPLRLRRGEEAPLDWLRREGPDERRHADERPVDQIRVLLVRALADDALDEADGLLIERFAPAGVDQEPFPEEMPGRHPGAVLDALAAVDDGPGPGLAQGEGVEGAHVRASRTFRSASWFFLRNFRRQAREQVSLPFSQPVRSKVWPQAAQEWL